MQYINFVNKQQYIMLDLDGEKEMPPKNYYLCDAAIYIISMRVNLSSMPLIESFHFSFNLHKQLSKWHGNPFRKSFVYLRI